MDLAIKEKFMKLWKKYFNNAEKSILIMPSCRLYFTTVTPEKKRNKLNRARSQGVWLEPWKKSETDAP